MLARLFNPHPPDAYAAACRAMLERQLRPRGIVRHNVLDAMQSVPRHLFVSHQFQLRAYADEALPSQEGQTISQPYIVAVMSQELDVHPGHHVLEIGTGTGYQTAILAHLVGPTGAVYSIERLPALAQSARRRLDAMHITNVQIQIADGSLGWPEKINDLPPLFDRILITAGAPEIPPPILDQLSNTGIIIAPIGPPDSQILTRAQRNGPIINIQKLMECRFVPLLGIHGQPTHPQN